MRISYRRTSTINQSGERFKLDKSEYDLILFDKGVSGKIPFNERENGNELIKLVNQGKVKELVVEELSRLGRNTIDVLSTLHYLEENKVNVVVRNMGNLQSTVHGKKNPVWNLITSVMSSLYEMERENILERTQMGRKMYVLNGGKLGRKNGSNENIQTFLNKPKSKQIIKHLSMGKSFRDISSRLGVSTSTIYKVKKHYNPQTELV
jgi:DNA invertase Pin-like site-specific DNA recombinase